MKKLLFAAFAAVVVCSCNGDRSADTNPYGNGTRAVIEDGKRADTAINLGHHSTAFKIISEVYDTSEEGFTDYFMNPGNDLWFSIILTERMIVDIHNFGSELPGAGITVFHRDADGLNDGPPVASITGVDYDIAPLYQDEWDEYGWDTKGCMRVDLTPGEYLIMVDGYKVSNLARVNGPILTTVIGHSYKGDGKYPTSAVNLGTHDSDFKIVTDVYDTSEEGFTDYFMNPGNDLWFSIKLTKAMTLDIHNFGSELPGTGITVFHRDADGLNDGPPVATIDGPDYDIVYLYEQDWDSNWYTKGCLRVDLTPGEYLIMVDGWKISNLAPVNGPILTTVIGRVR